MDERFASQPDELDLGDALFGPTDSAANPVIRRLAVNWQRRATVRRDYPDLLDLFDTSLPDYPKQIVPFADHRPNSESRSSPGP